jgi:hypothetical protein
VQRCYFVCLNDYIDKILIPEHGDYTDTASRTIHVPTLNLLSDPERGHVATRWYAKRAKLYAAFQKFVYQQGEIGYALDSPDFPALTRHFAEILLRYDFWANTEMWGAIPIYGAHIYRFFNTGSPGLMKRDDSAIEAFAKGDEEYAEEVRAGLSKQEIVQLWDSLALLPRNYEEVCREWFLPTGVGYLSS